MNASIRINRIPVMIFMVIIFIILVYFANNYEPESSSAMYGMLRNQNKVNLRKLLIGAIQASQRGGLEILDVVSTRNFNEKSKGKTDEGANDPKTAADERSHCIMKNGLNQIFPRLKIFSEEDKELCKEINGFDLDPTVLHETEHVPDVLVDIKDVTVWIDPLDATVEFTEKLYQYVTTMVCVAVRGEPIIGVIHSPFSGQTAWAWVGHSLSDYLTSIRPENKPNTQDKPIITVSRSHPGNVTNLIQKVFGADSRILTAAGAGYKVLQVIANNATAYLHTTKIKKWDICAGDAIIRALGGVMSTLQDELIDYGPQQSEVNSHGLLATIINHEKYIRSLLLYQKNTTQ